MSLENMTTDQIADALDEIGETGNAQLRQGNGLYTQREENCDWMFWGTVEDVEDAQALIDAHFSA